MTWVKPEKIPDVRKELVLQNFARDALRNALSRTGCWALFPARNVYAVIRKTFSCCFNSLRGKTISILHNDVFAGLIAKPGFNKHFEAFGLFFLDRPINQAADLAHRGELAACVGGADFLSVLLPQDFFHCR